VERRANAAVPDGLYAIGPLPAPLAVDGVPEHVEHARENFLANRRLKLPAGVFHRIAAGETSVGVSAIPRTVCASG